MIINTLNNDIESFNSMVMESRSESIEQAENRNRIRVLVDQIQSVSRMNFIEKLAHHDDIDVNTYDCLLSIDRVLLNSPHTQMTLKELISDMETHLHVSINVDDMGVAVFALVKLNILDTTGYLQFIVNKDFYAQKILHESADLLMYAWGIIANASGGDWSFQNDEWRGAASKFREDFHKMLDKVKKYG